MPHLKTQMNLKNNILTKYFSFVYIYIHKWDVQKVGYSLSFPKWNVGRWVEMCKWPTSSKESTNLRVGCYLHPILNREFG